MMSDRGWRPTRSQADRERHPRGTIGVAKPQLGRPRTLFASVPILLVLVGARKFCDHSRQAAQATFAASGGGLVVNAASSTGSGN